jgi:hypothetical protein
MAAALMRWWQMIHNGGSPSAIVSPNGITDPANGDPITDPVGGAQITEP